MKRNQYSFSHSLRLINSQKYRLLKISRFLRKSVNFLIFKALIGEGAFSQVYRVIRISDNMEYAMKQVKLFVLS